MGSQTNTGTLKRQKKAVTNVSKSSETTESKSKVKSQTNGSVRAPSPNASLKINNKSSDAKKPGAKKPARKERPKSAMIAGHTEQIDSNEAQYMHLSLEQIQQLAVAQQKGTLFTQNNELEENAEEQHEHGESCCHHSKNQAETLVQQMIAEDGKKKKQNSAVDKKNVRNGVNKGDKRTSLEAPGLIKNTKPNGKQENNKDKTNRTSVNGSTKRNGSLESPSLI